MPARFIFPPNPFISVKLIYSAEICPKILSIYCPSFSRKIAEKKKWPRNTAHNYTAQSRMVMGNAVFGK